MEELDVFSVSGVFSLFLFSGVISLFSGVFSVFLINRDQGKW